MSLRFDNQMGQIDSLDGKLLGIAGAGVTLVSIMLALPDARTLLALAAILPAAIAVATAIRALWPVTWDTYPSLTNFRALADDDRFDNESVLWAEATTVSFAVEQNEKRLKRKVSAVRLGLLYLVLAPLALAVALGLDAASGPASEPESAARPLGTCQEAVVLERLALLSKEAEGVVFGAPFRACVSTAPSQSSQASKALEQDAEAVPGVRVGSVSCSEL